MSDDRITTIREFIRSGGYELRKMIDGHYSSVPTDDTPVLAALDSLAADLAAAEARATEAEQERDDLLARGSVPRHPADDNDAYWLRQKTRAAMLQLRDIEDEFRLRGGDPGGFNMIRADRARSLHEQITADFLNGKTNVPTMREKRDAAVARANTLAEALAYWSTMTDTDEAIRMAREDLGYEGEARDD